MSFVHHSYKAVEAFFISILQTVKVIAGFLFAIPLSVFAGVSKCVGTVGVMGLRGSSTAFSAAIQATHIITRSSTSAANMVYNFLPSSGIEIINSAQGIFINMPATVMKVNIGISTAATYGAACTAFNLMQLPSLLFLAGLRATLATHSAISPFAALLPDLQTTATSSYQGLRRLADPAVTAVSTSPLFIYVKNAAWPALQPLHPFVPKVVAAAALSQRLAHNMASGAWVVAMGFSAGFVVFIVVSFVVLSIFLLPFFLACTFGCSLAAGAVVIVSVVLAGVFFGGVTVCIAPCIAVLFLGKTVVGAVQWVFMSHKKVD